MKVMVTMTKIINIKNGTTENKKSLNEFVNPTNITSRVFIPPIYCNQKDEICE